MVAEPLAAEVRLAEPVGLEHRAHRAVEDEDPLAQEARQQREPRRAIEDPRSAATRPSAQALVWRVSSGRGAVADVMPAPLRAPSTAVAVATASAARAGAAPGSGGRARRTARTARSSA